MQHLIEPSPEVKRLAATLDAAAFGVDEDHAPYDYIGTDGRLHHDTESCPRCRYKAARLALIEWLIRVRAEQWADALPPFRDLDYVRRASIAEGERALKKYRPR